MISLQVLESTRADRGQPCTDTPKWKPKTPKTDRGQPYICCGILRVLEVWTDAIYTYINIHICVYRYIHVYIYVYTYDIYIYTPAYINTYVYIHRYICTYTYIHKYIYA